MGAGEVDEALKILLALAEPNDYSGRTGSHFILLVVDLKNDLLTWVNDLRYWFLGRD